MRRFSSRPCDPPPAGLNCFTLVPGVAPRTFWVRRQAHETAIHRADLEAAAGAPVTAVDASFAQDGLGEIIGAFATEPAFATNHTGRLRLDASDGPAWLITFGGERNLVVSGDLPGTDADTVVRGTSDPSSIAGPGTALCLSVRRADPCSHRGALMARSAQL